MSTCSRFRGRRRIPPGAPALEELPRRYRALYTGAVSDVLDSLGLRQQALPHSIMPLAVVDGGVRDSGVILRMGFPVFCRFRRPARSIGRWAIQEWMVPIRIGDATISPDDFVCGDIHGVAIFPKELTVEVLLKTEHIVERERRTRAEPAGGSRFPRVCGKHGRF